MMNYPVTPSRHSPGNGFGRVTRGFTLLEVLLAVAILAIITTVIYSSLIQGLQTVEECRETQETYQIARVIFDRMIRDLSSAYVSPNVKKAPTSPSGRKAFYGLIGRRVEDSRGPMDTLCFTSMAHLDTGGSFDNQVLTRIGYYLNQDPWQDGFILYRRDNPALDDDLDKGGVAMELGERVAGLRFRYVDPVQGILDLWDSTALDRNNVLPQQVIITLTLVDRAKEKKSFETRVFIPMTAAPVG
ncbi:MAG: prepilin-type N-terminal cleavage/methylation domain-containing protein [Deltaproteobacteria bacterium]|nr:prepilin-type N-terminal cleavage/methylation domain-containing protein [Deltaproteobacteria bacterium]